ncbi:NUDIX domain-containing protein [Streptomyces sp. NBC_01558]|uniref:NUDIX domain-containing protein n=1 Tax=Streptomyces sp. NBC_01558 TaxID=2975878 RepID=UPI002DDA34A2|nr:NUDIX domain-containing protein [Streptomyces sp. NBC_01558]WSD75006.1 NUDIX domain-containing protein [Streptomyces sp. NBC_01558]
MPPSRAHIRATVEAYLSRHAEERDDLDGLLAALDGTGEPSSRATLPGHVTCSAVVIDRHRRVLHIGHRLTGLTLCPGGHIEAGDRTLLAAAVREVCEETGLRPGDLCLTPQFLDEPIDVDVHDIDANPAKGEAAHQHFDIRFAFYLTAEQPPALALQDEEVAGAQWLPYADVRSPTLRAKLLAAEQHGLDGRPEPVSANALIHDGTGRYLLHLRDDREGMWEPWVLALVGGKRSRDDGSLNVTLRRELAEEVPGLAPTDLMPFAVQEATSFDGLTVPIAVYAGHWSGNAEAVDLREGVLLTWCTVAMLHRLRLSPGLEALIRRHAAEHPAAKEPPDGTGPLADEAPPATEPHIVGGHPHLQDHQDRITSGESATSSGQRHTEPVDVHLILRRETAGRPQVLLSRRAGRVYAAGLWHLPSGHLDGPHEDVVTALVREAREETGFVIDPADVRAAVTVHHRSPGGASRTGHFFEVRRWQGEPRIAEPDVCDAMEWTSLDALPTEMVAYCRAGLDAYTAGARLAVHFQLPGDAVAFDPAADRLRLVPDVTGRKDLDAAVVAFAEQAVGRITRWTDTSWPRENSRVWRADGAQGGTWYVKVHQSKRFHDREVRGLRTWAPALDAAAPRLVAVDETLRAVVITAVPGRPLHGVVLAPERERKVFHRIGALARRIHQASPPRPAPADSGPAVAKTDRHLAGARSHLRPGDEEFVRDLVRQAKDLPPLEWVETHGDFQLRNILHDPDTRAADDEAEDSRPFVAVIDLERSEPGPAVRDLVRLSDAWHGRPDLLAAFLAGYGRPLTPAEQARLVIDAALDAVSAIAYGAAHGDLELVERGRRTLARLRAEHHDSPSPTGEPG